MDKQEEQLQKRCAWAALDRTACIAVLLDDVALTEAQKHVLVALTTA